MSIFLLDTNILLAIMLKNDSLHKEANDHLDLCKDLFQAAHFYTTLPCLLECSYLLGPTRTGLSGLKINQTIKDMLEEYAIQVLSLDQTKTHEVQNWWLNSNVFGKNSKTIDLADYYLVKIAHDSRSTIVTADDDISVLKASFALEFEIDPIVASTRKKRR